MEDAKAVLGGGSAGARSGPGEAGGAATDQGGGRQGEQRACEATRSTAASVSGSIQLLHVAHDDLQLGSIAEGAPALILGAVLERAARSAQQAALLAVDKARDVLPGAVGGLRDAAEAREDEELLSAPRLVDAPPVVPAARLLDLLHILPAIAAADLLALPPAELVPLILVPRFRAGRRGQVAKVAQLDVAQHRRRQRSRHSERVDHREDGARRIHVKADVALVGELARAGALDEVEQHARVLGSFRERRAGEANDHRVLSRADQLPQVAQQLHPPRVAQDLIRWLDQIVHLVHQNDLPRAAKKKKREGEEGEATARSVNGSQQGRTSRGKPGQAGASERKKALAEPSRVPVPLDRAYLVGEGVVPMLLVVIVAIPIRHGRLVAG